MLKWAIILAIVAAIAGILGFGGIAGVAMGIAKFLFFAALAIAAPLFALLYFPLQRARRGLRHADD